jgi:hypothetical protein
MAPDIRQMLHAEIQRIEERMSALKDSVKRHNNEADFIEEARMEMAGLHTRLDELHERQKKYAL